ncbi:MAG: hypothetical protein WD960_07165 [Gemmatimonadota bacterium]
MFSAESAALFFRWLIYASLLLVVLQIYLTLNRLWKRKHEPAVAQSISIMGEFVGLIPMTVFTVHFGLQSEWEGFAEGVLWIFAVTVTVLIGTGMWVEGRRGRGFWTLLLDSIRQERDEVGYLARSFLRPSNADQLISILGSVAMLDAHLDERERQFVQSFADAWHIEIDWDRILARDSHGTDPIRLRDALAGYLSTSPPLAQVVQLGDVLNALVEIDDDVSDEERLVMSEVNGLLSAYAGAEDPRWGVVLVPQDPEQERAVRSLLPDLEPTDVRGGRAFLVGRHHSREYAEVVGGRYRDLRIFVAVIRLDLAA